MFNLSGTATFNALSIARSGGDDATVVASIGVTFEGQSHEAAAAAIGCEFPDALRSAFFDESTPDKDRRFFGIANIASSATFASRHAFTMPGYSAVRVSRVKKITLAPQAGATWAVSCLVQIENPPAGMLETLAELIHEAVRVELVQDAELFDAKAQDGRAEVVEAFAADFVARLNEAAAGSSSELAKATVTVIRQEANRRRSYNDAQAAHEAAQDAREVEPLFDKAVEAVRACDAVSVSQMQRVFGIGYNRAARLVEAMEGAGVVSAPGSDGSRVVLPVSTNPAATAAHTE